MGKPHVVAIPYPAQGHVIPLMEVSQRLASNGIRVTFVNTEFNHERVMQALSEAGNLHESIKLVSIPDGVKSMEERMDHGKLAESISKNMTGELEALIEKINQEECDEVVCVVADFYMGFAMEVAKKLGIKKAAFVPASVAMLGVTVSAQKLIDDGIVDCNGTPLKNQVIKISPSIPEVLTTNLPWCLPDFRVQKIVFQVIVENNKSVKLAQRLICNTSPELEPGSLEVFPDCTPIGPLLAVSNSSGHFWPEDSTSLDWLDQQSPNSVIYVAFGSFTIFGQIQFQELATALELTSRPFLWVVRQDITQDIDQAYPNGFLERVKNRGKIVGWAPQQRVLSHSSVACFLSHCGWNSTMEGVSNGVPFLCWPYFADQFVNETYICDHWRVGLSLEKDGDGIIRCEEIESKVDKLLSDGGFRTRSLELQRKVMDGVKEGGCCQKNLDGFVDWVKGD